DRRPWPAPDWEVATPASQGVSEAGLEMLRDYFGKRGTRAALVIRHGRIIGEWYWDSSGPTTLFPVYSVTKSVASTAVGLLITDGKLKLEQSAADFLPAWRGDDRKAITVRHLVTMTSGLRKKEPELFSQPDQLQFALAQPLDHKPGEFWDYNNVACNTLSGVIAAASGMEMADFLQKRLYGPLGMTHLTMDKSGPSTLAYMGLHISARDLARFGYLFLNRGRWRGKPLLPETWVREATTTSQSLNKSYGYLWWTYAPGTTEGVPSDAYSARGLFGNDLLVIPSQDLIVVRLIGNGTFDGSTNVNMDEYARLALKALLD
ncbi:MAG: serine hydrolase, partial [Chloroflexota bacterium]